MRLAEPYVDYDPTRLGRPREAATVAAWLSHQGLEAQEFVIVTDQGDHLYVVRGDHDRVRADAVWVATLGGWQQDGRALRVGDRPERSCVSTATWREAIQQALTSPSRRALLGA